MAGRYSKFHSNYILSKKYQKVNQGTINERDWTTIGTQEQMGPGKRPYFYDGNFRFTVNNTLSTKKRRNFSRDASTWTYEDVADAKDKVNAVKLNQTSNDIRDFAYYGSAAELVRASVYHIVNYFPAYVNVSQEVVEVPKADGSGHQPTTDLPFYRVLNPFGIDFMHKLTSYEENVNPYRFFLDSYENYTINGNDITKVIVTSSNFKCEPRPKNWMPLMKEGGVLVSKNLLYQVFINDEITPTFFCYIENGEDVLMATDKTIKIRPKKEYLDEYFDSLEGFERQLLTLDTKPAYKNSFLTPVEGELTYKYVYRDYIWPSIKDDTTGYYLIDIETQSYSDYITRLADMAAIYDELWCDNLYRNMTHEAIKNFDWTYTKEYADGEEQDNIDGGNRVMHLLRVYGRVFDDLKRYADGIGMVNNVSYDGFNNVTEAELSDKDEMQGWDTVSTIPLFDDNENLTDVTLDDSIITGNVKWFNATDYLDYSALENDNEFMRKLYLSSREILRTKGTKHAIDMVMGMFGLGDDSWEEDRIVYNGSNEPTTVHVKKDPDYSVTEHYYATSVIDYNDTEVERIEQLNGSKNLPRYYDDIYSGVPLNDVFIGKGHYIVPYFDNNKVYDGDVYYQSKGGWGKYEKGTTQTNGSDESTSTETQETVDLCKEYDNCNYSETISYLHAVDAIPSLLSVDYTTLNENDIYYVANISDYFQYYDINDWLNGNSSASTNVNMRDGGTTSSSKGIVTNYFMINDVNNPERFGSWSVVIANEKTSSQRDEETTDTTDADKEYEYKAYKYSVGDGGTVNMEVKFDVTSRIKYLEGIISTTFGNNPHGGYGNYDRGQEYVDYANKPFTYAQNEYLYPDSDNYTQAEKYVFDIDKKDSRYDKSETETGESNNGLLTRRKIEIYAPKTINVYKETPSANVEVRDGDSTAPVWKKVIAKGVPNVTYYDYVIEEGKKVAKLYDYKNGGFTEITPKTVDTNVTNEPSSDVNNLKSGEITRVHHINSKVVIIENKLGLDENGLFASYFKNVIAHYLMQVIPSTTILVFKDYN